MLSELKIYENYMREVHSIPTSWRYLSFPVVKKELWDKWVDIVGSENIRIVSGSVIEQVVNGELTIFSRASFFISPEGLDNLSEIVNEID